MSINIQFIYETPQREIASVLTGYYSRCVSVRPTAGSEDAGVNYRLRAAHAAGVSLGTRWMDVAARPGRIVPRLIADRGTCQRLRDTLKWPPLSRPFFAGNKFGTGGSDFLGAAGAAPAIPALESALESHLCVALSSAQVPSL